MIKRHVGYWTILFLTLWVAAAWFIAANNFSRELGVMAGKEQQDAQGMSDDVADSIRRNLHYIAGVPNTFQQALRVWKAVGKFGSDTLPTALSKEQAIKRWTADPEMLDLDQYLASIQTSMGVDLLYVVNAAGDCISASNWEKPASLIGTNYADRKRSS
jgi:C4-dicarboxylate-specific signal transduction histidine kinase